MAAAPLADRIREALTAPAASADVAALLKEVEAAKSAAEAAFQAAHARALDPSLSEAEARAAQKEIGDRQFDRGRLGAAVVALGKREAELRESERDDEARREYEAAKAERDELAADLTKRWPKLEAEMIGLLQRLKASDARLARVNPGHSGDEWLASAEIIARALPTNFQNDSAFNSLASARLPAFDAKAAAANPLAYGLSWPNPSLRLVG